MLPFEKLDPLNAWYFTLKQDVSAMLMHTSVAKMCVCVHSCALSQHLRFYGNKDNSPILLV